MPETINVARLAELVSDDLFGRLGWEISGPPNESWDCTNTEVHEKREHPTDVTFVYQDPYTQKNMHLLTDLKSYAASSLKSFPLKETIENLALAVDCAKSNAHWKELYLKEGGDYDIQGLLFIYNHDKAYDREFSEMLTLVSEAGLIVPKGVKINVLSPKDIWHIGDMINDMKSLMADGVISLHREDTPFYYHSYSRDRLSEKASHPAATIDMLLGQYQSMTYVRKTSNGNSTRGLLVYYKGKGEEVKEFILLLDMLRAYGHLDTQDEIMIRCPGSSPKAAVNFDKAKKTYGSYPGGQVPETLTKIKFKSVSNVLPRISQYEVAYGDK